MRFQLTKWLSQLFKRLSYPKVFLFLFPPELCELYETEIGLCEITFFLPGTSTLPTSKMLPLLHLSPPRHFFPVLPSDPCLLPPAFFSAPSLFLTNSFSNPPLSIPLPFFHFLLLPSPCYPSCCGSRRLCGL